MGGSEFLLRRQTRLLSQVLCLGQILGGLRAGRGEVSDLGLRLWVWSGLKGPWKRSCGLLMEPILSAGCFARVGRMS